MRPSGMLEWHRPFAKSYQAAASSPVVWRDRVVIADRGDELHGLAAETGAPVWSVSAAPGFHGTPALDDGGRIFAGTGRPGGPGGAELFAIDAATGTIAWKRNLPSGLVAGPALAGARLVAAAQDGCLYAFERDGGALAWRTPIDGLAMATPAIDAGGLIWIGASTRKLHAVRADDGAMAETIELPAPTRRAVAMGPRGPIAVTTDGAVCAIAGDAIAWTRVLGGHNPSGATVSGGRVLVGAGDVGDGTSGLYVLDAGGGEVVGHAPIAGWIHGAPAFAEGVAYVGATDHRLHAIEVATCAELWSFGTGFDLWSSPLVGDAVVYFTAQNGCYALA